MHAADPRRGAAYQAMSGGHGGWNHRPAPPLGASHPQYFGGGGAAAAYPAAWQPPKVAGGLGPGSGVGLGPVSQPQRPPPPSGYGGAAGAKLMARVHTCCVKC